MKIYFASNIGGGADVYEIMFILFAGLNKRLFSYYYHKEASGMNLYFAGGENKHWLQAIEKAKGYKSLYSYFYLNKDKNRVEQFINQARLTQKYVFLDSGGFSAATKGVVIDIGEYAEFIHKNKEFFTVYANLDVIGDHKKTEVNQKIWRVEA